MNRQELIRYSLACEGDLVEFGVYKGDSACVITDEIRKTTRVLWLFDSFKGLPVPSKFDNQPTVYEGRFNDTSAESVQKIINTIKGSADIRIIPGFFKDTIHTIKNRKFCFVHIDCDLYEGYKLILEYIYPRMSKGGVVLLDDYHDTHNCAGAKKAVDEFVMEYKVEFINGEITRWLKF